MSQSNDALIHMLASMIKSMQKIVDTTDEAETSREAVFVESLLHEIVKDLNGGQKITGRRMTEIFKRGRLLASRI